MKASTFGSSDSNASGETSRLRKPARVVFSGPVTAPDAGARRGLQARRLSRLDANHLARRAMKRAPARDRAQQPADAALDKHGVESLKPERRSRSKDLVHHAV